MGSRERKREQRRKRKRRAATDAGGDPAPPRESAAAAPVGAEAEDFQARMARRSELKNEQARRALKPLADGERPTVVTVAAAVSAVLALVFTVSAVLAAAGVEISDRQAPKAFPIALFAGVLWLMVWGLWKARYWAVLGFQMLLVLVLLASALGLVQVSTIPEAVATFGLLAGSGVLFYFMIRAMARIQMPEAPGGR